MTVAARRLGRHTLIAEGDTLVFRVTGPFTMADAVPLYAEVERVFTTHGGCYLLADVHALGRVEVEARHYVASRAERQIVAVAMIGANPTLRTIAGLLLSAIRLMQRRQTAVLEFSRDEAEARRWLTAQGARGVGT